MKTKQNSVSIKWFQIVSNQAKNPINGNLEQHRRRHRRVILIWNYLVFVVILAAFVSFPFPI